MEAARLPWPALGMLLIRDGLVTSEELEEVLARQGDDRENRISSQRLGEALVANGTVTSAQVARLVAEQHELPFVDLDEPDSTVPVPVRLPEDVARLYCAMPIRAFPDGSVLVVVADPTRAGLFDDIRWTLGVPVRFAVAAPEAIASAIDAAVASTPAEPSTYEEGHENGRPPPPEAHLDEVGEPREVETVAVFRGDVERPWPVLGSLLLRDELVTEDELAAALAQQRLSSTRRLGEILVARGSLTSEQVSRALAEQHELPFVELHDTEIDPSAAGRLPRDLARAHLALPISRLDDGGLLVVVADPASAVHADELRAALGVPLQFAVATVADLDAAIESLDGATDAVVDEPVEVADEEPEPAEEPVAAAPELALLPETADAEDPATSGTPTLADTLRNAVAGGASAVHVTSGPDGLLVRARVDGRLGDFGTLFRPVADAAEAELAELGAHEAIRVVTDCRTTELRAATLPTAQGRRTTFTVVTEEHAPVSLDDLLPEDVATTVRGALEPLAGLVVICGPTPEGRATALRASMREVASAERVVLSVEDPVDVLVPCVEQVDVDALAGATYPALLRTILRSDPDVAVVGELLDPATATLAVRGARDCLVLTTVDAPTAASAIRRLLDLDVAPTALADALACVVGQAAVRRLCEACRESYFASDDELAALGRPADESGQRLLGRARGCEACGGTGYHGTVGLFEALPASDALTEAVARGAAADAIEHVAADGGVQALRDRAIALCLDGGTTAAELRRVGLSGPH